MFILLGNGKSSNRGGIKAGAAADHIVRESDPPQPATAHDRAKQAAEAEIRAAR